MKVAIAGANGATSALVAQLYANVGTDFTTMATNSDGLNINDGVGSTHPEALAKFVVEQKAQVGVAYDGDGDRFIAVDELGNIVDGDKIMYICGKYLASQGKLKQNTIVTTVMPNIGLYKAMAAHNLNSVKTKVGDRYVVEAMRKDGYNLGGEQSGHIVFLDHNTNLAKASG